MVKHSSILGREVNIEHKHPIYMIEPDIDRSG